MTAATLELRAPTVDDGLAVGELVRASGVLDRNSTYAYCATFRHFPQSCVVAWDRDRLAGFVVGYRIPDRPRVFFVWQVGVSESHRGQGLATRMLRWLLRGPEGRRALWLETTVTPSNQASRALFRGLADKLETGCAVSPGIAAHQLGGDHEPEELFRIGPLPEPTPSPRSES